MKISFIGKFKIWLIVTLAVLVAGIALFSFLGFNNSVDYKNCGEVIVSVDQNENGASDIVKDSALSFFESKGVSPSLNATQILDDGSGFIFKFNDELNISEFELKTALDEKLSSIESVAGYKTTVSVNNIYDTKSNDYGFVILALAVSAVLIFVYLFIAEKFVSAVSALCSSVISALLFVALMGITRIPARPYIMLFTAFAFTLSAILSCVLLNRFRETLRLVGNEKLSSKEVADKGVNASLLRFFFVFITLFVLSVALCVFGIFAQNLLFIGLQLLVATVVGLFSVLCWTPSIWAFIKG